MTLYVTALHIRALSHGVEGEEALRENRLEMTGDRRMKASALNVTPASQADQRNVAAVC